MLAEARECHRCQVWKRAKDDTLVLSGGISQWDAPGDLVEKNVTILETKPSLDEGDNRESKHQVFKGVCARTE